MAHSLLIRTTIFLFCLAILISDARRGAADNDNRGDRAIKTNRRDKTNGGGDKGAGGGGNRDKNDRNNNNNNDRDNGRNKNDRGGGNRDRNDGYNGGDNNLNNNNNNDRNNEHNTAQNDNNNRDIEHNTNDIVIDYAPNYRGTQSVYTPVIVPPPTMPIIVPPPPPPPPPSVGDGPTVVDLALSNDDFSILVAALTTANLVTALSSAGPFTVFAPTNDAFIALINALGITAEELLAIPSLPAILLYHVAGAHLSTEDLATMTYVQTLNGQTIAVEGDTHSGITLISQQGGASNIIIPDLEATNGVVHAVDAVLLPLFDTVVDIALSFEDFSLLVAAVDHVGLTEALMGPGPFTVFAPPNSAFEALMAALGINVEQLLNIPSLRDILLYHVIGDFLLTHDLAKLDGQSLTTLKPDGQTVEIDTDGTAITLIDQQGWYHDIVLPDVQAKNGVVHVIDSVMLPLFETVLHIAQSFDAFTILVAAVEAAGLTDALLGPGPFTVFAPCNDAFLILITALGVTVEDVLKMPALPEIILYHVIGDFLLTQDLTDGHYVTLKPDGQTVEIAHESSAIQVIDNQQGLTGIAQITLPDVQAKNGVAHVIDRVLLPIFDTMADIAMQFDKFSILVDAVERVGLEEPTAAGPYTCFAPDNEAFFQLFREIHIDYNDLMNIPQLEDILQHHIVNALLMKDELRTMDGVELVMQDHQNTTVRTDGSAIANIDAQSDQSNMGFGDILARNGVVHVVDRIFMPLFIHIMQVARSVPSDYSMVTKLLEVAGMTEMLEHPNTRLTVFAPNNKAIEEIMKELYVDFEDLIRMPTLRRVLQYHMVPEYLLAADLKTRDYTTITQEKQKVFVNADKFDRKRSHGFVVEDVHLVDQQDMKAPVLFGNAEAFNGVVHVIQRVMIPMFDSVMEIAESFDDYSILVKLVHCGGLEEELRRQATWTVFAPNNKAFGKLMFELRVNVDDLCRLPMLRDVLWHHINGHWLHTWDFGQNKELHQENGQYVKVWRNDNNHQNNHGFAVDRRITMMDQQEDFANILFGDVQARNGIVHVVDRVLILRFQSVVEIGYAIDDYSILMRCLEVAGLIHRYDSGGSWTVFAPNNRAFHILMEQLLIDFDDLYAMPTLRQILMNHVVPGYYLRSDLERMDSVVTDHEQRLRFFYTHDSTHENHLNGGGSLDHGFYVDGIGVMDMQDDSSRVIIGNAEARNGVVFVIDRVNVMLFESIMQIARSIKDYSILVRLVEASGLDPLLDDPQMGPYTVFAPNNRAVEILMDELLVNLDDLLNLPNLPDVIWYHIIGQHLVTPQLSRTENTIHEGQEIYVDHQNNDDYAGYDVSGIYVTDQQHDIARMIIGNVEARNGVVNVVDRVRVLLFDSIVQIAAVLPAYYSMLHTIVYAAGIDEMLIAPGSYTVFAPNNDAFEKLFAELHIDLDDLIRMPLLKDALFNHIVDAHLYSTDLPNGPIENLLGQSIYIDPSDYDQADHTGFAVRGIQCTDMQQRNAYTLLGNVEAKNGIVHVIDRVMIFLFDTVVDIATSFDDYSILVQLVVAAELVDTLAGPGPFTVFAPNNDAFYRLMDELHITVDDLLKLPNLSDVLLYHILDRFLLSTQLPTGDTQTINGQTVNINQDNYDGYVGGFDITGIQLTDAQHDASNTFIGNVQANNGVVYVIDRVMIPLFDSVVQVATSLDDYSILVELVVKAGLVEALSGMGPFTVFAPNNEAFYKLMDELLIDMDDLLNLPSLTEVLFYHVVHSYLLSSDLSTGDIDTLLGQSLYVNVTDQTQDYGFVVTNTTLTDQQTRECDVFIGNVETNNGVVFVIDRVMIPMFDSIVQIATSFDDYSILVQLLVEAGLVETLTTGGPFTVFAPNNDAMYQLMDELRITLNDLLKLPILQKVLLYHVHAGYSISTDLSSGPAETLNGDNVFINTARYDGYTDGFDIIGISVTDGQYHASNVFIGNVLSNNGVVYVVDRVMIPLFDNIVQIATSFDDFSILVELVVAAGLADVLLSPDTGPFTVFAPNNYAFYKLMDELHVTLDDLLHLPNLVDVLLYHVLSGELTSFDLKTDNYTTLNGQSLWINADNYDGVERGFQVIGISMRDAQSRDSYTMIGNVRAQNGIVHVIDTVLLPMFDTIVDIATSFEDFSILVGAVTHMNLTDALVGNGPFTVFAPHNDAFDKLMNTLDITVQDLLNLPNLSDVLLYHVVNDYVTWSELSHSNTSTLTTMQGQTLQIRHTDSNTVLIDQQGSVAVMDPRDVRARNGIVHVIDTVMLPLFESIGDIATSLEAFSILVAALNTAGLSNALGAFGPFTVFAPTNTAFNELVTALGITLEELLQLDILTNALLYHVVINQQYSKQDLIDLTNDTAATITTMNGETLAPKVVNEDDVVLVSANGAASLIIVPDVWAKNGVVHVIDRVMLPPFDTVVDVATALDEFSILVAALTKAGLAGALTAPGAFTVFAPTNTAFRAYLEAANMTLDELLNLDELAHILLYHCIDNHIYTKEGLISLSIYNGVTIKTKSGETIQPQVVNNGNDVILYDKNGGAANIIIPDVAAKNGIVHAIDNVMLPFPHAIEE